jgi:hypothetical protein
MKCCINNNNNNKLIESVKNSIIISSKLIGEELSIEKLIEINKKKLSIHEKNNLNDQVYDQKWQMDIVITSVFNSQTITMAKALMDERMASTAFLKKITKYGKHPLVESHIIKPIVLINEKIFYI